jgi:ATP-binding cassette subfamily D (ALD) protein 2
MTQYAYSLYMKNETYYRVGNLDSRITNADQCLTQDINKFCSMLAHLHSQLSKPILDVVLMSMELLHVANSKGKGSGLVAGLVAYVTISIT